MYLDKHLKYILNYGILDFNNWKEMWILSTTFIQLNPSRLVLLFPVFEDISRLYRSLKNSAYFKKIFHLALSWPVIFWLGR